jgi:putative thioredoxin
MLETAADWIYDVTDADFEQRVMEESRRRPVVIDFWGPDCPPCSQLSPLLERLVAERRGQVVLAKVNVYENPALAEAFGIESIPDVKAIRDGRLILQFRGALPEVHLRTFLDRISPTEEEKAVDRAEAQETADPAAAEKSYRDVLAKDAANDPARIGLARVLLARNRLDEIADVLAPVAAEGEPAIEAERIKAEVELRRRAATLGIDEAEARRRLMADPKNARAELDVGILLAARGAYEEALQHLLAAAERDFKLAQGEARQTMVQVFYALGSSHPLANEYRAKLAQLLY